MKKKKKTILIKRYLIFNYQKLFLNTTTTNSKNIEINIKSIDYLVLLPLIIKILKIIILIIIIISVYKVYLIRFLLT